MRAQQAPLNKRDLSTSIKPSRLCVRAWTNCSQPRSLPLKQRASFQTGHWQRLQDPGARAGTDGLLTATLPARVSACPSLQGKGKNLPSHRHSRHPRNGINKTTSSFAGAVLVRSPCGQNRDSVQKFRTASFPDFDQDSYEVKCKKGSDNVRLVFQSKATCQQFLAANSWVKGSFSQPKTLWHCATPLVCLSAKPGPLMSVK